MNRRQLEHVLRASGSISGCQEIVVVGSQAILGAYPDAPPELLIAGVSYPLDTEAEERLDDRDGCRRQ
jgi:hypothetical protein